MYNIIMELSIDKNIILGKKIAVAVSGGKDSMCLLNVLYALKDELNLTLSVVNIEHGIRGEASVRDSAFVAEQAKKLGLKLHAFKVDTLGGIASTSYSVEEYARMLRYNCFSKIINNGEVDYIALAQHRSDQCETIMMRILRGTGIIGLVGMEFLRDKFIRPILDVDKETINKYIVDNNIPYVEDETNNDNNYTRNFIRNILFPLIKQRFGGYEQALLRLRDSANDFNSLMERLMTLPDGDTNCVSIPLTALDTDRIIAKYNIKHCFYKLGVYQDIEKRHLDNILKFAATGRNGTSIDMPYNTKVYKEYDRLSFAKLQKYENIEDLPLMDGENFYGSRRILISTVSNMPDMSKKPSGILYCDRDKLNGAVIRRRRDKDSFAKYGCGHKSLGDYLTDIKLPIRYRDNLLVIADGNEVLAIVGREISDLVKIDEKTTNICTIEEICDYVSEC